MVAVAPSGGKRVGPTSDRSILRSFEMRRHAPRNACLTIWVNCSDAPKDFTAHYNGPFSLSNIIGNPYTEDVIVTLLV